VLPDSQLSAVEDLLEGGSRRRHPRYQADATKDPDDPVMLSSGAVLGLPPVRPGVTSAPIRFEVPIT
jgi:hypothetical protein